MKINLKWSSLTTAQRKQVIAFHEEQLEKREIFQHNLNQGRYQVNPRTGNVVHHKDF